jgi:protein-disulfide isomerase
VLEKYPNDVKFVIKHFPLDIHEYARKAAIAALAAGKQGKFWEMHEKLFAAQADLNDEKVANFAKELSLDMDTFNKDLKEPAIGSLIDRDTKDGAKLGIQGTPSVFVNGKLLNQRNLLLQAVEAQLKKKPS